MDGAGEQGVVLVSLGTIAELGMPGHRSNASRTIASRIPLMSCQGAD